MLPKPYWILSLLGISLALSSVAGAAGLPPPELTVVATPQIKESGLGRGTSEIGPLDPATTPQAEQTFLLKNENAQPVTVARLRASCGCESLLLLKRGALAKSVTLAPGEEVSMQMSVNLTGQRGGPLHKYAWVYAPNSDTPLASLEMILTLRSAVSCSPEVLNFGSGPAGISRSLQIMVTADRSVLLGDAFPVLISDSSDVQVTAAGKPIPVEKDKRPALIQKYQIFLKAQTPIGYFQTQLRYLPMAVSGQPVRPSAFAALSLAVTGEILGQFSATPKTLFFGSVSAGKEITRQIVLTGPSFDGLKGLQISAGSHWLNSYLGQPRATEDGATFLCPLQVTLSAHTPVGSYQEQITLVTDKGDRLVIPVVWETIR